MANIVDQLRAIVESNLAWDNMRQNLRNAAEEPRQKALEDYKRALAERMNTPSPIVEQLQRNRLPDYKKLSEIQGPNLYQALTSLLVLYNIPQPTINQIMKVIRTEIFNEPEVQPPASPSRRRIDLDADLGTELPDRNVDVPQSFAGTAESLPDRDRAGQPYGPESFGGSDF